MAKTAAFLAFALLCLAGAQGARMLKQEGQNPFRLPLDKSGAARKLCTQKRIKLTHTGQRKCVPRTTRIPPKGFGGAAQAYFICSWDLVRAACSYKHWGAV